MSVQHMTEADLMARPTEAISRLRSRSAIVGAIGIVLAIFGYFVKDSASFWQSYLIGFYFWNGLTLGSMAVMMVHQLSGGGWGMVGRRIWEAATRTLPLNAVLFIPILLNMRTLYPWARPGALSDPQIASKVLWLNPTAFTVRAVIYFVIWGLIIFFLNKWSHEQDGQPVLLPGPQDARSRTLSGPGLVLYMITITFMSTDWVMSLDPHWYSTIWGIITLGGQGLEALAFTLIVVACLVEYRPMSEVAGTEQIHDISKLMFAFVMLWGYFSVSQLIIVWSGNLPDEIPYYLNRGAFSTNFNAWTPVSAIVLLGEFILPFCLLLSRKFKQRPRLVRRIAFLIIIARVVDTCWQIGPMARGNTTGAGLSWLDLVMVVAIGGLWLPYFWRNLAGRAIVPAKDPYFKEALVHGGH